MPMKAPHVKPNSSSTNSSRKNDIAAPASKNPSEGKKRTSRDEVLSDEEAQKIDQKIAEKEMRYPQM